MEIKTISKQGKEKIAVKELTLKNMAAQCKTVLSVDEEKETSKEFLEAYFLNQKLCGAMPSLIKKIMKAISANFDFNKGSLTTKIKSVQNTLPMYKKMLPTENKSHISDKNNNLKNTYNQLNALLIDFDLINTKLSKLEFTKNAKETSELEESKENILNDLNNLFASWEFTPKMREYLFKQIKQVTDAYNSLNKKGNKIIRERTRLRYSTVLVDVISGNVFGISSAVQKEILNEVKQEIELLENLTGRDIKSVINTIHLLKSNMLKQIKCQNKLIESITPSITRSVGMYQLDNEQDKLDMVQEIVVEVSNKALYNYDGSYKLSTYIRHYVNQVKSSMNNTKDVVPLPTNISKFSRSYVLAKIELEANGNLATDQEIADWVNKDKPFAKATRKTVQDFFNQKSVYLSDFESDNEGEQQQEISHESTLLSIGNKSVLANPSNSCEISQLEDKILSLLNDEFGKENAGIFQQKYGLHEVVPHTLEQLKMIHGVSKDLIRKRINNMVDYLQNNLKS